LVDASLLGIAAPIAWSRGHPLMAAATCLLAVAAISRWLIPIPISGLDSAMLAIYLPFSVAAFSDRRGALVGLAICGVGFIGAYGFQAPLLPILAGAWVAGRLLGDRTRLVAELEATNRTLAEERDRRAHQLMLEERLRVARDLHDVIGHTLMVVVLQAGAARRNWASDRDRASRAIGSLANVARDALTELLAGLLALDETSNPVPASPGLVDIDALVAQARAAGIRVELSQESLPAGLNPELELTAYRVVQEALTNVMKHAPRSATYVRIQARGERLQVEVVNSGPLTPRLGRGSRGGQGLSGMAQRVAAGGGELSWGRDAVGGFAVQARLPIAT
jgi:signal transduction histidine kinase